MSKVGRIMLLVIALVVFAGATLDTQAKTPKESALTKTSDLAVINEGKCSSYLVSSSVCEANSQSCSEAIEPVMHRQIQSSSLTITKPNDLSNTTIESNVATISQESVQTENATPTMAPLESKIAPDDAVLDSEKIFSLVNQYRSSRGLAPFEQDAQVCSLAETRSREIVSEISSGVLHSGLYNRNLPYWIWENAKYGSNEEGTVAWWLASPIHHQSIVGDYKYSCVKCNGSYCAQLFTSFVPK